MWSRVRRYPILKLAKLRLMYSRFCRTFVSGSNSSPNSTDPVQPLQRNEKCSKTPAILPQIRLILSESRHLNIRPRIRFLTRPCDLPKPVLSGPCQLRLPIQLNQLLPDDQVNFHLVVDMFYRPRVRPTLREKRQP